MQKFFFFTKNVIKIEYNTFIFLKVQKKLIYKGESDGNIGVDVAVQHGAVQCSLVHYISVWCSVLQCSIV